MNQVLDVLLQKPLKPQKLNTEATSIFKLVGGKKEKVSFLSIYHDRSVEIVDSDLDMLVLSYMIMDKFTGVQNVNVDRLYHVVNFPYPQGLTTKEVTIFDMLSPDSIDEIEEYSITLGTSKWSISGSLNGGKHEFEYDYSLTKNIGFIGYFDRNATIHREKDGLTTKEITFFNAEAPNFTLIFEMENCTIILQKAKWTISFKFENEGTIEHDYGYSLTKNIGLLGYFDTNITIHRESDGLLPNLRLDFDSFIPIGGPSSEISRNVLRKESKLFEKRDHHL